MKPTFSRRNVTSWFSSIRSICFPAMMISPFVGFSNPANIFRSVDFPEPDGPTIAQNSPLYIVKSTPFKA